MNSIISEEVDPEKLQIQHRKTATNIKQSSLSWPATMQIPCDKRLKCLCKAVCKQTQQL